MASVLDPRSLGLNLVQVVVVVVCFRQDTVIYKGVGTIYARTHMHTREIQKKMYTQLLAKSLFNK